MKKLGFIALFLCCCMALNLSMATAADVEAASDAELPAAVAEAQPDADAEITADDEELDAELMTGSTLENISYSKTIEGGVIYFDAINGIVKQCVADEGKEVTSVEIPAAIFGVLVTKIADKAFQNCSNLTDVVLPNSIVEIGANVFSGCTALTNLTLPDSVTILGAGVFSGCTLLESIVLSTKLTAIPATAFSGCTNLTSVTISTNVTSIGKNAFAGCNTLKEMHYKGTLEQWLGVKVSEGNRLLIDAIDPDGKSFEVESPKAPPVIINSVTVSDMSGKALKTIPTGQFLASVSITGLSALEDVVVFFAAYGADGKYQGSMYAFVQSGAGATARFTLPFENPNGNISQIRAFAVKSLGDLTPLGNPVTFSA